jgi:hypothetical protein
MYVNHVWHLPQQCPVSCVLRHAVGGPSSQSQGDYHAGQGHCLVWMMNKTTVEIHSAVMEYYEAYNRAVVQTQANVTMIVPTQDW